MAKIIDGHSMPNSAVVIAILAIPVTMLLRDYQVSLKEVFTCSVFVETV